MSLASALTKAGVKTATKAATHTATKKGGVIGANMAKNSGSIGKGMVIQQGMTTAMQAGRGTGAIGSVMHGGMIAAGQIGSTLIMGIVGLIGKLIEAGLTHMRRSMQV